MRKLITGALVCVLLVLAAGSVWARPGQAPGRRPAPRTSLIASRPETTGDETLIYLPLSLRTYVPGYVSPFGVAFYSNITTTSGLDAMEAAGARWTSTYFLWSQIEPNAPVSGTHTYYWSLFDAKVANARGAGMAVYAMFSLNPSWAAALPGGPVTNTANLLAIAAAAAERYDGDGVDDAPGHQVVNYWAYYMEPDNRWLELSLPPGDRGYWGHQPQAYADMLAQVADAIHTANPNAVVMPGAVAYDNFYENGGPFERGFLAAVLDHLNSAHGGADNYIDAVPFHYYPISPGVWSDIHEKTEEIRGILNARGLGHLPLLVPEMGYWSEAVPPPNDAMSSSPAQQARRLAQMYLNGLAAGLTRMAWFQVFDGTCCSPLEEHGLFFGTNLGDPKPSYWAYKALVSEMNGAYYVGPVSSPGVRGFVFSIWKIKNKTAAWATQPTANLAFAMSCLRRVDYLGNVTSPIYDGNAIWDKDAVTGQITLQLVQDETLYVEAC